MKTIKEVIKEVKAIEGKPSNFYEEHLQLKTSKLLETLDEKALCSFIVETAYPTAIQEHKAFSKRCSSDNSYNYSMPVTRDYEITTRITGNSEDAYFVAINVHQGGDIRGNYMLETVVFVFEDEYAYIDAMESFYNDSGCTWVIDNRLVWVYYDGNYDMFTVSVEHEPVKTDYCPSDNEEDIMQELKDIVKSVEG